MTRRTTSVARGFRVGTVAALVVACLVALFGPAAVSAQSGADAGRLVIDRVDARGESTVVEGALVGAEPSGLTATVDGEPVDVASVAALGEQGLANDVIAVIDNSGSLPNAAVQLAKQALEPLMPGQGAVARLGVVTTGGGAEVVVGPTDNASRIRSALQGVEPVGISATWDGVVRAGALLDGTSGATTPTVVLFSASAAAAGEARAANAGSALQRVGARLDAIVLPMGTDGAQLPEIVADVGGTLQVIDSDEEIGTAVRNIADGLEGRFRATLPTTVEPGSVVPLSLEVGELTAEVGFSPGFVRVGADELAPVVAGGSGGIFANELIRWLALLLAVTAAVMLVWAVVSLLVRDRSDLTSRLEVYDESYGAEPEVELGHASNISVPMLQRAVDLTGELADQRGLREKVEIMLERANLPLRAPEAIFFLLAASLVLSLLGLLLTGSLLGAVVALVLAIMLPVAVVNFMIRRRQKEFVGQLPDMLTLLAGTLRAGYSIGQGFESVSGEVADPMGRELRRVVTETRLGRPLEEALEAVAQRMGSDDFSWAVMAIRIQREVGGNLAELLLTVADTMTQRERLRRDVSTLTAEGRISAIIIGLLPPGLGVVMFFMNPEYISELFTPGTGYALIATALVSMAIGFAWMKKTITIEV